MISAVIFDFDGVLADTERLHLAAFVEVFAARGWALDEAVYFERYLGFDDRGLVREYASDHRLELCAADADGIVAAKTHAFARLLETGDVLYADAAACVHALSGRFRLAIASGALHAEITRILESSGLLEAFPVIVGADDVSESKPLPAPYLAAASRLGVLPADCVAIEDSHWGLTAARQAGMRTIALPTTSPRHLLASADRIVSGLCAVTPDLVAGLNGDASL